MTVFKDDFLNYGTKVLNDAEKFGPWTVGYAGYGYVAIPSQSVSLVPKMATKPSETHAVVVLGPSVTGDLVYQATLHTYSQLRGTAPNTWEVAWMVWNYTDDNHFYYFIPKPNGWELGKVDPAYPGAQRFLADSPTPVYPIYHDYKVKVKQVGSTLTVYVNDALVVTFTDHERPYLSGAIGMYCEDSNVSFSHVSLQS